MKSSLQHTIFDLLSSEPHTQANSLSIKKRINIFDCQNSPYGNLGFIDHIH